MQKIETAIILAAGMGVRLKGVIDDRPKGLLEIGNREIIKESLDRIAKGGIKDVIIVTGYAGDKYHAALADEYPHIRYLENSEYAKSGSMHSLFQAREEITGDFLMLESDLLYEDRCIPSLVKSSGANEILISGKTGSGDEVYVYGDAERKTIQKITKNRVDSLTSQGELTGISKLSLPFFKLLCDYYEENLDSLKNAHYEECISDLALSHDVHYLKIPDIVWTEIDDPSHYKRAVELIYPKIYGKSKSG
jgi:choline kinase